MLAPLTTNDVRVLRVLLEAGPMAPAELERALSRQLMGSEPAMRRVARLRERRLLSGVRRLDVTGDGAHALRAADRAAYGAAGVNTSAAFAVSAALVKDGVR